MTGVAQSGAPEGGEPLAVDSRSVLDAAEFAVGELAAQSNSLAPPKLKEVRLSLPNRGIEGLHSGIQCINWLKDDPKRAVGGVRSPEQLRDAAFITGRELLQGSYGSFSNLGEGGGYTWKSRGPATIFVSLQFVDSPPPAKVHPLCCTRLFPPRQGRFLVLRA